VTCILYKSTITTSKILEHPCFFRPWLKTLRQIPLLGREKKGMKIWTDWLSTTTKPKDDHEHILENKMQMHTFAIITYRT